MKKELPYQLILVSVFLSLFFWNCTPSPVIPNEEEESSSKMLPHEWMYAQRAFPDNHIDKEAIKNGYRITKLAKQKAQERFEEEWELAGPVNIGGRITDIALHPTDQNIIYVGTAVGGIFKTSDGGENWEVVFEDEGALSIGNLAIAPSDPNILYVGSGEANGSATSGAFFGDGIYKTSDGGDNWEFMGLENTQHIGRIVVDPENADRVFVAAAGVLYGKNNERGLYRTLDGGDSWENVLFISDSTACIDVVINPENADLVYAATWERIRQPWQRRYGGLTSRIYRSFDGGESWEQLTNGLPADDEQTGRIGLAISPSEPNVLYTSYTTNFITNTFDGIYKSEDAGTSWTQVDDGSTINFVFSSFGWFFGNLRLNPGNSDDLWVLGVQLVRSFDGAQTWTNATNNMHVDFHALEIHPQNPDLVVAGNDGGVYISNNGGSDWEHVKSIPNNMFYNCEIDHSQPERIYAGAQDQGSVRTVTGNVDDFERILGGDGFHIIVDPVDPSYVYAEFQFGNLHRSDVGGPNMQFKFNGEDDRTNWNTPIVMDPTDPLTIYYGGNRLWKSIDRGDNFEIISDDLTDGLHPSGSLSYGTITTIAVSLNNPETIYTGSDDGNVNVTFNGGDNWTNISSGIPNRYVTGVAIHPQEPLTAYVTLSGYRSVDYQPHILTTVDGGDNWEDISSNLPEIPINDIIVHPDFPNLLFIANDMGVWYSTSSGAVWEILGTNMPFTVVNDLDLHAEEAFLIAATFGRSMLKLDISQLDPTPTKEELAIRQSLKVYPNPVRQIANVAFTLPSPSYGEIQILSLNGRLLKKLGSQHFSIGRNENIIDFTEYNAGTYLVRITTEVGIFTTKLVKV